MSDWKKIQDLYVATERRKKKKVVFVCFVLGFFFWVINIGHLGGKQRPQWTEIVSFQTALKLE